MRISTKAILVGALLFSSLAWSQENNLKKLQNAFLDNQDEISKLVTKVNGMTSEADAPKKVLANDKLEELFTESNMYLTAIYDLKGVKYEVKAGEFSKKVGKATYIRILPEGDNYLNRFAKFLDRINVQLVASQKVLFLSNAEASFQETPEENIFIASAKTSALIGKDVDLSIHEMIHALFDLMWNGGYDSDFLGFVISKNGAINPNYGKSYADFVCVDEIAAYAENSASAARKLYRDYVNFYASFSPSIIGLDKILQTQLQGKPFDAAVDKQYLDIILTLKSFMVTSGYSKGRDDKLFSKAAVFFGDDFENYNKFVEAVSALYDKGDLLSEIPRDIDVSKIANIKTLIKPVIQSSGKLQELMTTGVNVSAKLEYVFSNIIDAMHSTYVDTAPSEDYEGAFEFKSGLVIQYAAEKNIKYYVVSYYWGDISYTTLVSKDSIKDSSEDAIITASYVKINEQLNMVKTFKEKNAEIKKDLESLILAPGMDELGEKSKSAEVYVKNTDFGPMDLSKTFDVVISLKEKTSAVRGLYRDNIARGVESWSDIIKTIPAKTTPVVTTTVMTAAEIEKADAILTRLTAPNSTELEKQKELYLLVKYLKLADENNNDKLATTIRASINTDYYKSVMDLLGPSQIVLINKVTKVSYVKADNEFDETAFRDLMIGPKTSTTNELAVMNMKKIVESINTRWKKKGITIATLLTDDQIKLLAGKNGLLDFIQNKIDLLPTGGSLKRAYTFSLKVFMDVIGSTDQSRVQEILPDFKTEERKVEVENLIEGVKANDIFYEKEYECGAFSKSFKLMDNAIKEIE